jgi:hypothetical protein
MRRSSRFKPAGQRASFSSQTWVGGGPPMTPSSDLVRDRTAVNALIAEVAGNAIADANVSETAKAEKKIVRDCLKGEGRHRVGGFLPRLWRFRFEAMTPIRPCKTPRIGKLLRLYLLANEPRDSGADASSAAEFWSRRVARESIVRNQI